jgi:hypothetical protein
MAAHDAIPQDTLAPGTTLYRCRASPGEIVVIHALGRFRPARVLEVGRERIRLICPAECPHEPTRLARYPGEIYALVGTSVAGVIERNARPARTHRLTPAGTP